MKSLPEGYKVFITHFRRFKNEDTGEVIPFFMTKYDASTEEESLVPLPTGGATEAAIVDSNGNILAAAFASCSKRDHFSKRIGRDIATGRALKKLEA